MKYTKAEQEAARVTLRENADLGQAPKGTRVRIVESGVTGTIADTPRRDTSLRFVQYDRQHDPLKLAGFGCGMVHFPRELEVLP